MLLIKHRVNSIAELKKTPARFGVEVDIRPYADKLVLSHDPFVEGDEFEEFMKNYNHSFIILNIKSEGIEQKVIDIVESRGVFDYLLLDVSFPFIIKLVDSGVRKIAVRFSEYESINTCISLKGRVDWVFVDNFSRLPVENKSFHLLRENFKLCIVSPELLGRKDLGSTFQLIKSNPVDAVLTKMPEEWEMMINDKNITGQSIIKKLQDD